jgi:hypothetical protein
MSVLTQSFAALSSELDVSVTCTPQRSDLLLWSGLFREECLLRREKVHIHEKGGKDKEITHTFVNATLSGCTVRIASVRPCRNAFVIAGSYVHSMRPSGQLTGCMKKNLRSKLTIKTKIRCLKCHLHKGIWAESMPRDEALQNV